VSEYHGAASRCGRTASLRDAAPLVLSASRRRDLVFAVDSIPAIFAVTKDPFIVYTSNIFAILGLRSMFFLLAGVMDRFHYLKVGLATVLVFVGMKMTLMDVYHVPIGISLGVIALILGGAIAASWIRAYASPRPRERGRRHARRKDQSAA
jgi:tellurite resistance protein TerC